MRCVGRIFKVPELKGTRSVPRSLWSGAVRCSSALVWNAASDGRSLPCTIRRFLHESKNPPPWEPQSLMSVPGACNEAQERGPGATPVLQARSTPAKSAFLRGARGEPAPI